jgi:hypothetical protein
MVPVQGPPYLQPEGTRIGAVTVPNAPTPQMIGMEIEEPIRQLIAQRYGLTLPPKNPNATGPDVLVPASERLRLGFSIADVKPLNERGIRKFWEQLDNWRDWGFPGVPRGGGYQRPAFRGKAALFGYDSQGNVYLVGIWEM